MSFSISLKPKTVGTLVHGVPRTKEDLDFISIRNLQREISDERRNLDLGALYLLQAKYFQLNESFAGTLLSCINRESWGGEGRSDGRSKKSEPVGFHPLRYAVSKFQLARADDGIKDEDRKSIEKLRLHLNYLFDETEKKLLGELDSILESILSPYTSYPLLRE